MTKAEWLACEDPSRMLEYAKGCISDRKLRLFACACVRQIWGLLTDERGKQAVLAGEYYADGLITKAELTVAKDAAGGAAGGAARDAAWVAVWDAASAAARAAVSAAVWSATGGVARNAARDAAWDAARDAARSKQADLLRDITGNPWQSVRIPRQLITADILSLAQAAYDNISDDGSLDSVRSAILADALEEAGCAEGRILLHLRSVCEYCEGDGCFRVPRLGCVACRRCNGTGRMGSPHVRGCWALDLVLGKE